MIIYKITNRINGKIYIGQTIFSLAVRKNGHLGNSRRKKRTKSQISNAIAKYGIDNFIFETLCETDSIDELNDLEKKYISELKSNTRGIGYNTMSGGLQKGRHSEETKKIISESVKKPHARFWSGKHFSEEHKKKIGDAIRGKSCPSKGHWGDSNPLKNPLTVLKMLATRKARGRCNAKSTA